MRTIEMMGKYVYSYSYYYEKELIGKCEVSDFITKILEKNQGPKELFVSQVLPPRTRFYAERDNRRLFIIEDPPQVRTIKWGLEPYAVALPYIVYFFYFEDNAMPGYKSRLFYSTTPITSLDNPMLVSNLTHVVGRPDLNGERHPIGTVCLKAMYSEPNNNNIVEHLDIAMCNYWNSNFTPTKEWHNNDFAYGAKDNEHVDPRIKTIKQWRRFSKKDPLFVLEVPWISAKLTLRQVVDAMMAAPQNANRINTPDVDYLDPLIERVKNV